MFLVMYCATACVFLNQFKVVPLMPTLMEMLGVTSAEASWLLAVFTVVGIFFAIPAGALISKFGPKKTYIAILAIMICGSALGTFALDNFALLLVSRVIEGASFIFVSIAGIVLVNMWFPDKNTGLFVGIFMTTASIGSLVILNSAIPLSSEFGVAGVWWIINAATAVFTVLFALIVKEAAPIGGGAAPKAAIAPVLKNKRILCISIVGLSMGWLLYFFLNNYPTIFMNVYGMDIATASFYGSLDSLFGIPFCIIGGLIVDKIGIKNTPKFMIICLACLAVTCLATAILPSIPFYLVHIVLIAFFPGVVVTAYNCLVPLCVESPVQIGNGIGVVNTLYNLGIFLGSPIVLYAVEAAGTWTAASVILASVAVLAILAMLAYLAFASKEIDPPSKAGA